MTLEQLRHLSWPDHPPASCLLASPRTDSCMCRNQCASYSLYYEDGSHPKLELTQFIWLFQPSHFEVKFSVTSPSQLLAKWLMFIQMDFVSLRQFKNKKCDENGLKIFQT
ncbi:hypothetical protein Pst134EA_029218 [Puccinia striiformis f. sp. tritici]|uniref:hypothetical protein n=1 Tax=Puccinia striiformis f. sp. tritici TaxID=168172 RepID=UPI0020073D0B|nr:hypothetical protein Pst134EA_029218 [Puccinia striiformis f. sp. tritici]KAH9447177.1 hypothetical protein Pst134EA_029218 [Puccinia striiformis f. sp. tritici]